MTATLSPQKTSLFGALNALADEIQSEKQAAARVKQAEPTPADPGGYQGPTSHPVKNVDNNVQTATEGARSAENVSDVKEEQGKPGVDSTPEAKPGESQDQQLQIGTTKKPTGEDPAVEDKYKDKKDDPGTTMPAEVGEEKYGAATFKQAFDQANSLANDILADLANGFGAQLVKGQVKQATPAAPAQPPAQDATLLQKAAAAVKAPSAADQAVQAGYELAAAMGIEKQAAMSAVRGCIEQTIRDAQFDADLLGGYLTAFRKRAAEEAGGEGEDHNKPGDEATGASEAPPDGAGEAGPGGGGGGGLEALLGAAGGGGGADMGGGPPPGGPPPGGAPAGPAGLGGEPSEEEALQELAAALEELGIPVEALAQAAPGGGGGGGGEGGMPPGPGPGGPGGPEGGLPPEAMAGGPPPGAGMPPPGAAPGGEGMKLAQAVQRYKLSGRYQIKEASTKRARHIRDVMKAHVRELLGLK